MTQRRDCPQLRVHSHDCDLSAQRASRVHRDLGPIIGLKEQWKEQGATPQELGFPAFAYRCEMWGSIPIQTGHLGGHTPYGIEETEDFTLSRDELEHEIPLLVASGGCVLALDHRIPNGTPLENYRSCVRKAWEIIARERARPSRRLLANQDRPGA